MALNVEETLEARKPGIVAQTGARLDPLIELASYVTDEKTYGEAYNLALALRVLHMLEMENRGGTGGNIKSEKEGDLARSYGDSKSDNEDLKATAWGNELIQLTKMRVKKPVMRNQLWLS